MLHTNQRYIEYPSSLRIHFYSDDWRKEHEQDMHYRWMPDQHPDSGTISRASGARSANAVSGAQTERVTPPSTRMF